MSHLSRDDVVLGRALLAWGLVPQQYLLECAEDVRRLQAQGRPVTLGEVLVQRGFLSVAYYQAIVARLHQMYLESSSVSPHVQQATQSLPHMNAQGHYTRTFQQVNPLEASAVERAVAGWSTAARQVTASGSNIEVATPPPPSPAGEPVKRAPPDKAIRKKLGVPEEYDRFPIGNWMVEQYLDAGAQGIVYRVSHPAAGGTPYALKILKELDATEQLKQRFVQEARTMAKLSHRGIAHVHDAGVAAGLLWFVMDFLPGKNLKQVIEDQGALGLDEAKRIMGLLCDAVAYAHSQAVLHRDLKPDNVIMAKGTDPVLTDFGLAKDVNSGMNLTREGQRLGTPLYMAPELLLDAQVATPQSEVYALTAMLWQCLTGKVPYHSKSLPDLVKQIRAGKLPALKKLCPGASRQLEKLCQRGLDKDPARRPQSVVDLRDELAQA
ncbi:MAG: serine/threonine-protein kinase [Planctomycetota bacterium]